MTTSLPYCPPGSPDTNGPAVAKAHPFAALKHKCLCSESFPAADNSSEPHEGQNRCHNFTVADVAAYGFTSMSICMWSDVVGNAIREVDVSLFVVLLPLLRHLFLYPSSFRAPAF